MHWTYHSSESCPSENSCSWGDEDRVKLIIHDSWRQCTDSFMGTRLIGMTIGIILSGVIGECHVWRIGWQGGGYKDVGDK